MQVLPTPVQFLLLWNGDGPSPCFRERLWRWRDKHLKRCLARSTASANDGCCCYYYLYYFYYYQIKSKSITRDFDALRSILSSLFFLYAEEWNFYIPHSWYKNFPQEIFFVYRNNFVTACRGEAAVKGVAEPLSARNKQIWDGEHLATGQKGRSWVKKNRGLLETRISNTEFLLFALLCCNLIYSLKCSVRLNITWVSFHQVRNTTQIGLRKKKARSVYSLMKLNTPGMAGFRALSHVTDVWYLFISFLFLLVHSQVLTPNSFL